MSPLQPVTINTKRGFVLLVVLAAIALPVVTYSLGRNDQDACENIHTLYQAIDDILVDTNGRIQEAAQDGRIKTEDLDKYLKENQQNRNTLAKGDCSE